MKKIGSVLAEGGGYDVYEEGGRYFCLVYPSIWDKTTETFIESTSPIRRGDYDSLLALLRDEEGELGYIREGDSGMPVKIKQLLAAGDVGLG